MKNSVYRIILKSFVSFSFFVLLVFVIVKNDKVIGQVSSSVSNVLTKVDNVVSSPIIFISKTHSLISDLLSTYTENADLKKSMDELENQSILVSNLQDENASLRASLDLKERFTGETVISAYVSSRTPVAWLDKLTLNVGANNGVSDSMIATSNGGVIGFVNKISNSSSTIELLSDSNSNISLASAISNGNNNYVYGIISSYDPKKKLLEMTQLNSDAEVKVGDSVVTSGLDSNTMKDVPVGKVESILSDEGKRTVYVKPFADFDRITYVTLIGSGK